MPCYFVSSGVEIPMTNQTFDFFRTVLAAKNWLTAKHFYLKKATKQTHPLTRTPMLNGETTTENQTTKSTSKNITKRKRNDRADAIHAVLTQVVNETWQSTRKPKSARGSWFDFTMILWYKKISSNYNLSIFLMPRLEKEKVLERIYYHMDGGFGSARDFYEKARESRCRHNRNWMRAQPNKQTRNYKNYNSYTAPFPKYEFQIDLMDVTSLLRDVGSEIKGQLRYGFIRIDIFSKRCHIVLFENKDGGDV